MNVRQRTTVNAGIGDRGRRHLLFRRESAARVQWQRDIGALVEVTGSRTAIPMAPKKDEIDAAIGDIGAITPIPYYPGMENLWIVDESSARIEANDRSIVNPLTVGAEAYYTYALMDSVSLKLPTGQTIRLREMQVRPRRPEWNLALGSFWFDEAGHLVKCVYRLAAPVDVWRLVEAEGDSSDQVPGIVQRVMSPLRIQVTGIAIEYSLMEGRFWLPSMRSVTGDALMMFARLPMSMDQRFEYRSVNAPVAVPFDLAAKVPSVDFETRVWARRDSVRKADRAFLDALPPSQRLVAQDSMRRRRDFLVARARFQIDSTNRARDLLYQAVTDSVEKGLAPKGAQIIERGGTPCDSTGVSTRYAAHSAARMPMVVRVPCNLTALASSPDLPPSIYDSGAERFSAKDRDEMMRQGLALADQPPFSVGRGLMPKPTFTLGFAMSRFNRVEGFSTGIAVDQQLGAGLSVDGSFRFGFSDHTPSLEINAQRSNLAKTISGGGYHRLVSAGDWGSPLSFGSSVSALIFGRDEGFYYRATGGELKWTRGVDSRVEWRLFAEGHAGAPVRSQTSLAHRSAADTFPPNISVTSGRYIGSAMHIVHNHGLDPRGFRTFTNVRIETARSDSFYARGSVDVNLSMGTPLRTSVGLTLSGGTSAGYLPPQRRWYLGGAHTVRGQDADTSWSGNAYALTRLELARVHRMHRSSIFGDAGWVGSRQRLALDERLLTGVGLGESLFDGLLRLDLSRGLQPKKQWRFDVYLEARF